jgi:phage shock protein C
MLAIQGVGRMPTVVQRNWLPLAGVAALMTLAMLVAGLVIGMTVYWNLVDAAGDPSSGLVALVIAVLTVPASVPALVVGWVAGLRRWWLGVAVLCSLLLGAALGTLAVMVGMAGTTGTADEEFYLLPAVPGLAAGLICGSLIAVAFADHLGGSGLGAEPAADGARPRLRRSSEHRAIAGVCAGLANSWGMTPTQVRLLAVAATVVLWFAAGVFLAVPGILYLLAWLTWPLEPAQTPQEPTTPTPTP